MDPLLRFATLLLILTLASESVVLAQQTNQYPQDALQCYTTSALNSQKDGVIICPADRQGYCIKEVVNATSRADCGTVKGSIYYGRDVWDRKVRAILANQ